MSLWRQYGFRSNPYSTDAIRPTPDERPLLVGRDQELEHIARLVSAGARVVPLEGDFGVGKTSLAAASAYDASTHWRSGGPLFLLTRWENRLQLDPDEGRDSFEWRVWVGVAQCFIDHADLLKRRGYSLPRLKKMKRWLREPENRSWSATAGLAVLGTLGGGGGRSTNTSAGFTRAGFTAQVNEWLTNVFPEADSGAVICVLENLEELRDPETALRVIEPLRDSLFKRNGLLWFISGARGMVRVTFGSPKMEGVFHQPLEVLPLAFDAAKQVVAVRLEHLAEEDPIAPVTAEEFVDLYESIGRSLRFALNLCERYATLQDPSLLRSMTHQERHTRFVGWLSDEADRITNDMNTAKTTKSDWRVFETLIKSKSGVCSPSEFADFGYASQPPLLLRIQKLKSAGLVEYETDPDDGRRRVISATSRGRMAYYRHAAESPKP